MPDQIGQFSPPQPMGLDASDDLRRQSQAEVSFENLRLVAAKVLDDADRDEVLAKLRATKTRWLVHSGDGVTLIAVHERDGFHLRIAAADFGSLIPFTYSTAIHYTGKAVREDRLEHFL